MKTGKSSIGQRLHKWRKAANLRLAGLAKKISVSPGSLSELENDKSLPSTKTLINLHQRTSLNIMWLLLGTGNMLKPGFKAEESGTTYEAAMTKTDEKLRQLIDKMVRAYNLGGSDKKIMIEGFLDGIDSGKS